MFFRLNELWRVGYRDDPLSVSIQYQGYGRFDDPQRERTVLYGSDTIETCIMEIALPWAFHPDAAYTQRLERPEGDDDPELRQAELDEADRDRQIAEKPAQMPADLYTKAKVFVALAEPVALLDLDDISVRRDLAQIPDIATRMRALELPDLDRSVLTGRHLDLTRAIAGHLMRHPFAGQNVAGVRALRRGRDGTAQRTRAAQPNVDRNAVRTGSGPCVPSWPRLGSRRSTAIATGGVVRAMPSTKHSNRSKCTYSPPQFVQQQIAQFLEGTVSGQASRASRIAGANWPPYLENGSLGKELWEISERLAELGRTGM